MFASLRKAVVVKRVLALGATGPAFIDAVLHLAMLLLHGQDFLQDSFLVLQPTAGSPESSYQGIPLYGLRACHENRRFNKISSYLINAHGPRVALPLSSHLSCSELGTPLACQWFD